MDQHGDTGAAFDFFVESLQQIVGAHRSTLKTIFVKREGQLMTLIVSSVTAHGIALAADSMLTQKSRAFSGRELTRFLTNCKKIVPIERLKGAVSMWGDAEGMHQEGHEVDTDCWLADMIGDAAHFGTIGNFAEEVRRQLEAIRKPGAPVVGFHISGYEKDGPVLYHVRNDDDDPKSGKFRCVREISPGESKLIRNGDYATFGHLFDTVLPAMDRLLTLGKEIPHPSLPGVLFYQMAWIRFVSDLYRAAQLPTLIGVPVYGHSIAPDGTFETYCDYELVSQDKWSMS